MWVSWIIYLWSGPNTGYGAAEKIEGLAWDASERLLSVQSTGFYNIHHQGQLSLLLKPRGHRQRISCSITQLLVQVTDCNYNDGLAMDWLGLASVGTSEIYK